MLFRQGAHATCAEIDSDCGEQIIKVLLMWQPRHFFDHTLSSAAKSSTVGESNSWILGSTRLRNRGFTFAAFLTLIEPLRQLDQGYMELTVCEFNTHTLSLFLPLVDDLFPLKRVHLLKSSSVNIFVRFFFDVKAPSPPLSLRSSMKASYTTQSPAQSSTWDLIQPPLLD